MHHTHDLDSNLCSSIEDQVLRYRETTNVLPQIASASTRIRIFRQKLKTLHNPLQKIIGVFRTMLGNMGPDLR